MIRVSHKHRQKAAAHDRMTACHIAAFIRRITARDAA